MPEMPRKRYEGRLSERDEVVEVYYFVATFRSNAIEKFGYMLEHL